jgi:hypothetical protein
MKHEDPRLCKGRDFSSSPQSLPRHPLVGVVRKSPHYELFTAARAEQLHYALFHRFGQGYRLIIYNSASH